MIRGARAGHLDDHRWTSFGTATTQGDASPFLENLMIVDAERVDILRGAGSSIYGTSAVGGVVNVVTNPGGGKVHGSIHAEGGGLGFARGYARVAGGAWKDRVQYSSGLQHVNVSRGNDGNAPIAPAWGQLQTQWVPQQR
jgi:iron complex outermembrane receptor protein